MPERLGFLASHRGTSARAIVAACADGTLPFDPAIVVCNNRDAEVLQWARDIGLPHRHLSGHTHPEPRDLDAAICDALMTADVELVVLSGYMKRLGSKTVGTFRNRILNIHPAPLPAFGGKGMYGARVHQAVLEAGVDTTAVTIHLVDEHYDQGPVLAALAVPVGTATSAEELQSKVVAVEPEAYIEVLRLIAAGELLPEPPAKPVVLPR